MSSGGIQTKETELVEMYLFIANNPGLTPGKIARKRGLTRSKVLANLVAMEAVKLCVSEDDKARLYPFSCGGYLDH